MTASELANWIAFGALAFLVVSACITFAFGLGRVFQRVGDLRNDVDALKTADGDDGKANSVFREAFAEFRGEIRAQITHLDGRVADLARSIAEAPPPPYGVGGRGARSRGQSA